MGHKENQRQTPDNHKHPAEKSLVFLFHPKIQGRQLHPKE
jgi:hypothetical protein